MVPNISRGFSFKGVTAYLVHDAREDLTAPHPITSDRLGFFKLYNFHDGEARTPEEAAKVMALTVRDADRIKRAAGIPLTGGKPTTPPVYHASLSWAKSETPTEAEKESAVREALSAVGLAVEKGYLAYAVEHTDTDHHHIHFVACLVHPETGKQANPHRDQPKMQEWARNYDRRRGQIFCPDREAKYAALDRARASHGTATRAAFNDNSAGAKTPEPQRRSDGKADRYGRGRERKPRDRQQRPEWQARQAKTAEANAAADKIKAEAGTKWAALKAAEKAAFAQRGAEFARLMADRKAGRDAIFEKYRSALDEIWKGGPKTTTPDFSGLSRAWETIRQQQDARRRVFEANERSGLGRLRNALKLAGRGASLLKTARLALSPAERRREFERGQRAIAARLTPRNAPKGRPQATRPEPKRVQAERLKAMRAKELAEFSRETNGMSATMKARHEFQKRAEKDARTILSAEIGAAWKQHRAAYPQERKPDPARRAEARPEAGQQRNEDRYGRSRDRQRQPRHGNDKTETPHAGAGEPTPPPGWTSEAEREQAISEARERREAGERAAEHGNDDMGRSMRR